MSSFAFEPLNPPFPRWMGPFSPARGNHCGFRVRNGQFGVWVEDHYGMQFWSIRGGAGTRELIAVVHEHWGGGRILLLPNGFVIKPLQVDNQVGVRALVGSWCGEIVLNQPSGSSFNLSNPGMLQPGHTWTGPKMMGLECVIRQNGSLVCQWSHPEPWGANTVNCDLRGPDPALAAGFHAARPGDGGGRVRVTACGHVITNRQDRNGVWGSYYVGRIDPHAWRNWEQWIE